MMGFWVIFGVLGLMGVPLIVSFLVCGVDAQHKIGGALVCLAFWIVIAASMCYESAIKAEAWNGGYCECGEHWELRGTTKSRNGTVTKYYVCPECFAEIKQ